jgi:hypothetical protein
MSAGEFLARMGIARLGRLGDTITQAIVSFDPATASQVQIDQMGAHCQELGGRVAEAEVADEKAHKVVLGLQATLSKTKEAAKIIGDRLKALPEGNPSAEQLNTQLNTLMDQIEAIAGPEMDGSTAGTLFEANQDFVQAEADWHEWQTVHAGAVESWTTARKRLEQAAHDMEHAQVAEAREHEKQAQAERDAGLKTGMDTQNIALDAMTRAAEQAQARARAATITTQAIKASTGQSAGSADDIVKQTLATAAPKTSALDRLARLG